MPLQLEKVCVEALVRPGAQFAFHRSLLLGSVTQDVLTFIKRTPNEPHLIKPSDGCGSLEVIVRRCRLSLFGMTNADNRFDSRLQGKEFNVPRSSFKKGRETNIPVV